MTNASETPPEGGSAPRTLAEGECTVESILLLKGLDPVRKVPGMYVGDVHDGSGLHKLIDCLVTRAVNEHLVGHCRHIEVTLHHDGWASVRDDGRALPTDVRDDGEPVAQARFSQLPGGLRHAPETFFYGGPWTMESIANALCERLTVETHREGRRWFMAFGRGKVLAPFEDEGEGEGAGTVVRLKPDDSIFTDTTFSHERVEDDLRRLSFLLPGLTLTLRDERGESSVQTFRSDGVADLARRLGWGRRLVHGDPLCLRAEGRSESGAAMRVEVALQWTASRRQRVAAFVNGVETTDGGTHLVGLRRALAPCLMAYARETGCSRPGASRRIGSGAAQTGLTSVVSLWHGDPRYTVSARNKLTVLDAADFVEAAVQRELLAWLRQNPEAADAIITAVLGGTRPRRVAVDPAR